MNSFVFVAFIGLVGLLAVSASGVPPELIGTLAGGRVIRAVANSDQEASVVRSESEIKTDSFQYVYETNNGISAQASGSLKKVQPEGEALSVQGQYQYTAPDGSPVRISYVADEAGYQPSGAHIPTPPPTPSYILSSLQFIAAHPAPVDKRP